MAKSGLYSIRNGSITFEVAKTTLETDARTGNVTAVKEFIAYDAYIENATNSDGGIDYQRLPGADAYKKSLICYLVSPTTLDSRVIPGTPCSVNFPSNTSHSAIVIATKFPYGDSGVLGGTLSKVLGDTVLVEQDWAS